MDFNVKIVWVLDIFGIEVWITETIVNTWIIMGVLIVLALIVRMTLKKFTDVPKGLQNVVELMVDSFDGVVKAAAGEEMMSLGGWFFMSFAFILVSNLSGLFGLRPPTADWTTTFTFALATFIQIQAYGIARKKGAYLKSFIEPYPVFLPLNIIGELARPISLSFRLFGNVLAGMILMTMFYALTPIYLHFALPAALHTYFDLFSGVLQTYIFCVLSLTFIGAVAASPKQEATAR